MNLKKMTGDYNSRDSLRKWHPLVDENFKTIESYANTNDTTIIDIKNNIQSANNGLTTHKTAAELDHPNKSIKQRHIGDKQVGTGQIADYAVGTGQIAQGAVNNNRMSNGSVDARVLADGGVTEPKLAPNSVTAEKVAPVAIELSHLANEVLTFIEDNAGGEATDMCFATPEQAVAQGYPECVQGLSYKFSGIDLRTELFIAQNINVLGTDLGSMINGSFTFEQYNAFCDATLNEDIFTICTDEPLTFTYPDGKNRIYYNDFIYEVNISSMDAQKAYYFKVIRRPVNGIDETIYGQLEFMPVSNDYITTQMYYRFSETSTTYPWIKIASADEIQSVQKDTQNRLYCYDCGTFSVPDRYCEGHAQKPYDVGINGNLKVGSLIKFTFTGCSGSDVITYPVQSLYMYYYANNEIQQYINFTGSFEVGHTYICAVTASPVDENGAYVDGSAVVLLDNGHIANDTITPSHLSPSIRTTISNKVDKVSGKGLSTNDYTTTEKTKLAGIATDANNYVHPDTHPASIIETDTDRQFVSQAEKDNWNAGETGGTPPTGGNCINVNELDGVVTINYTGGGSGTETDPYRIATVYDLEKVRTHLDAHFILTADIDLGMIGDWTPIGLTFVEPSDGCFAGVFDGDGYSISNLNSTKGGLFGANHGTIRNIRFDNVFVNAGSGSYGYTISSRNYGVVSCCGVVSGTVIGRSLAAGLVLENHGIITDCYNKATIGGDTTTDVGGIVSYAYEGGTVANCYNMGMLFSTQLYAEIGVILRDKVSACYGLMPGVIVNRDFRTDDTCRMLLLSEFNMQSSFTGWDFKKIWNLDNNTSPQLNVFRRTNDTIGSNHPDGSRLNPYRIKTITQLLSIENDLTACYVLDNDIDLSRFAMKPIGSIDEPFTGSIDGQRYTIKGVTMVEVGVQKDNNAYLGLFVKNCGTISNLQVTLLDVKETNKTNAYTGIAYVGGIAAINEGTIEKSSVAGGMITATYANKAEGETSSYKAGSIAAINTGTIKNSYTRTTITADYMGGIAYENTGIIDTTYGATAMLSTINLAGIAYDNKNAISNSYALKDLIVLGNAPVNSAKVSTTNMKKQVTFVGWDFDTIWEPTGGITYPMLRVPQRPVTEQIAQLTTTVNTLNETIDMLTVAMLEV